MKVIKDFKGVLPAQDSDLLPIGYASKAIDCEFLGGALHPIRGDSVLRNVDATHRSIYEAYGQYFTYPCKVSLTDWLPNCPRTYITGLREYPIVGVLAPSGAIFYHRLGVCTPRGSIVPQSGYNAAENDRTFYFSSWLYTYVNSLGEESSPSFASEVVLHKDGQAVTLQIESSYEATYTNISGINVYRASTGYTSGAEKEETLATEFLFVKHLPISIGTPQTLTTVDDMKLLDLGWVLETREVSEPPQDLRGIIRLEDSTTLAGFVGNCLYFSEVDEPHAWKQGDELTLDDNIMQIIEQAGLLYVLTDGSTYMVDVKKLGTREPKEVRKFNTLTPLVSCTAANPAVKTKLGIFFPSTDGLYNIRGVAEPENITKSLFKTEQWRQLTLQGVLVRAVRERLFVFTPNKSWYLDPLGKDGVIELSALYKDVTLTRTNELVGINSVGAVVHLFSADFYKPFVWVSNRLLRNKKGRFNVLGVKKGSGEIQVIIQANRNSQKLTPVETIREVLKGEQEVFMRLSRHHQEDGLCVQLEGEAVVSTLMLADRYQEFAD
jgi:hypothetical protein